MGVGTSIFLIALGAVFKYAVTASVEGIEIATVGVILMVAGAIGLLLSLFWATIYSDRQRGVPVDGPPVADAPVRERTTTVERDVV